MKTVAPSPTHRRAVAYPMPVPAAAVTSTRLPASKSCDDGYSGVGLGSRRRGRLHGLQLIEHRHAFLADVGVDAGLDLLGRPTSVGEHGPHLTGLVPHRDLVADRGVHLAGDVA